MVEHVARCNAYANVESTCTRVMVGRQMKRIENGRDRDCVGEMSAYVL